MISSLMRQGLKELWTRLDRTFGIDSRWSTSSTRSILDPKISASTLSDEVVQDKEEVEVSTQSINHYLILNVTVSCVLELQL